MQGVIGKEPLPGLRTVVETILRVINRSVNIPVLCAPRHIALWPILIISVALRHDVAIDTHSAHEPYLHLSLDSYHAIIARGIVLRPTHILYFYRLYILSLDTVKISFQLIASHLAVVDIHDSALVAYLYFPFRVYHHLWRILQHIKHIQRLDVLQLTHIENYSVLLALE